MEGSKESGSDYLAKQGELREEVDKNGRLIKKANRVLKSKDADLHAKTNAALDMRDASEEQGMLDREIRDNIDDRLGIPKFAKTPDFDKEYSDDDPDAELE